MWGGWDGLAGLRRRVLVGMAMVLDGGVVSGDETAIVAREKHALKRRLGGNGTGEGS